MENTEKQLETQEQAQPTPAQLEYQKKVELTAAQIVSKHQRELACEREILAVLDKYGCIETVEFAMQAGNPMPIFRKKYIAR